MFEVLELITDAGGDVSLVELTGATELPRPTIHRILRTLIKLGYARQLPSRRYALGPRLIRIGAGANRQFGALARPQLEQLVEDLGESVNMAILDVDLIVYVAHVSSQHSMRMFTEVGRRASLHNTGAGKAILAQLPDDTVRSIIGRTGMAALTEHSITDLDDLLAELERIRARGYAIDEQEQEIGVRCYAMAVPNAPTPTAVSVSGPVSRVDGEFGERAVPFLRRATRSIADESGAGAVADSGAGIR
ncbi:IclR family acetate operon transcriptional repressor [Microbacterium pseudoresistens]|uniref:IclR family acetate operon transcriptional repressor n=2 Tax=Microbacterium pseudoresistens TaxID=640634 RepID=A0A7Y9EVI8_9MICO|nr:IclR family acetate operon transcriptional repressor [Microbacterium pseudoresistens]